MTNATDNNRPLSSRNKEIHVVFSVSEYSLENKEDSQTPYLVRTAEARGVRWGYLCAYAT